ncbi:MAG TPA: diguanylate cyclase [Solirubrobacteraceae bacterium]|nr:diguanylate cyclase [Solirubrobacteraceae bacterium]
MTVNVVVAHTDPGARDELATPLREGGYEVAEAADFEAALAACQALEPDVALVSKCIEGPDGGTLLDELKSHPDVYDTAVVLVAPEEMPSEQARRLFDRGAEDLLVEPVTAAEVVARVRSAARTRTLQRELVGQGQRLETLVHEDPLTGLFNRRSVLTRLAGLISGARRHGRPLSIAMIDVDHFKRINDAHGHDAGDTMLVEVTGAMRDRLRAEDALGRLGGEEFLALLPDSDEEGAATVAEDLRASVQALQARCGPHLLCATISVGWATWDGQEDADRLIKRADVALYEAKDSGRNAVRAAESGSASLRRRT